jgi:hypothetical protein
MISFIRSVSKLDKLDEWNEKEIYFHKNRAGWM